MHRTPLQVRNEHSVQGHGVPCCTLHQRLNNLIMIEPIKDPWRRLHERIKSSSSSKSTVSIYAHRSRLFEERDICYVRGCSASTTRTASMAKSLNQDCIVIHPRTLFFQGQATWYALMLRCLGSTTKLSEWENHKIGWHCNWILTN